MVKIPGQQGPRLVEKPEIDPVFVDMAVVEGQLYKEQQSHNYSWGNAKDWGNYIRNKQDDESAKDWAENLRKEIKAGDPNSDVLDRDTLYEVGKQQLRQEFKRKNQ